MMCGQLSSQKGLKGIKSVLALNKNNFYHLGIKIVKLDHSGYIPSNISVTTAKVHEMNAIREITLKRAM